MNISFYLKNKQSGELTTIPLSVPWFNPKKTQTFSNGSIHEGRLEDIVDWLIEYQNICSPEEELVYILKEYNC